MKCYEGMPQICRQKLTESAENHWAKENCPSPALTRRIHSTMLICLLTTGEWGALCFELPIYRPTRPDPCIAQRRSFAHLKMLHFWPMLALHEQGRSSGYESNCLVLVTKNWNLHKILFLNFKQTFCAIISPWRENNSRISSRWSGWKPKTVTQ